MPLMPCSLVLDWMLCGQGPMARCASPAVRLLCPAAGGQNVVHQLGLVLERHGRMQQHGPELPHSQQGVLVRLHGHPVQTVRRAGQISGEWSRHRRVCAI